MVKFVFLSFALLLPGLFGTLNAQPDTMRIYFLGNSLTNTGDNSRLSEMTEFGKSIGKTVYAELSTYLYHMKQAYQTPAIMDKIRTGRWDYVVISNDCYEGNPSGDDGLSTFIVYGGLLVDSIRAAGATPLVFIVNNINGSTRSIVGDSCMVLVRAKNVPVIPVNMAFRVVATEEPSMPIYTDWAHPSPLGGYMGGCVFFSAIFGQSPFKLPFLYGLKDSAMVNYEKVVAWEAVMADSLKNYRLPWATQPALPVNLHMLTGGDSLTQYFKRQLKVVTVYDDSTRDTSGFVKFRSLTPAALTVDYSGLMTGLSAGVAQVEVELLEHYDTAAITVVQSSAVLDSIFISPHTFANFVSGGTPLTVTGYFHEGSYIFNRDVTTAVAWSTDTAKVKIVNGKIERVTAKADTVRVIAALGGVKDSITFVLEPDLRFLTRIRFQADTVPFSLGWRGDNGALFDSARGFGWITRNNLTIRADRQGTALQSTFISPAAESEYKINAWDGDYILKIGMGDNYYGLPTDTAHVRFRDINGIDHTLITHAGPSNTVRIDTIRVFGNDGIHLFIKGPINYLVAISMEGVDINDVALDDGTVIPMTVEENRGPTQTQALLDAFPNPFNPSTTVRYVLPKASRTELSIFNVDGRCVRRLFHGVQGPGFHRMVWDGQDDQGRASGSGIYVLKLAAGEKVTSRRIMLMR